MREKDLPIDLAKHKVYSKNARENSVFRRMTQLQAMSAEWSIGKKQKPHPDMCPDAVRFSIRIRSRKCQLSEVSSRMISAMRVL